jgi:hypothetical protein
MRLKGRTPRIEADASNLAIVLDARTQSASNGAAVLGVYRGTGPVIVIGRDAETSTSYLAATDATIAAVGPGSEPVLSFRTASDVERLRVGPDGVSCGTLTAARYQNLVQDYRTFDGETPPAAAALAALYRDMSNAILSGAVPIGGDMAVLGSLDLGSNLHVRGTATVDGATVLAGGVTVDTVSAGSNGVLSMVAPAVILASSNVHIAGRTLGFGPPGGSNFVTLRCAECNLGINLPDGVDPVCTLHVNGAVFASEELFALSDMHVKTDVRPVEDALQKLTGIRGCTYLRTDYVSENRKRHLGVIAQEVQRVVPEAVHSDADGRLSVAYGNLVAVAIEAIKELRELRESDAVAMRALEARVRLLESTATI